MYAQPAFRIDEQSDLTAFIAARRFASLVIGGAEPVAAYLPLLLTSSPDGALWLEGHLARSNGALAAARTGARALAIFHGADAYVTPALYASKREHGKVVPTWNYVAAEAHGTVDLFDDAASLHAHVSALTAQMESSAAVPWQVSDAPADYIDRLVGAIVGVRLRVDRLEGIRKLSQNRSEADFAGVLAGFSHSSDPGARQLAETMKAVQR